MDSRQQLFLVGWPGKSLTKKVAFEHRLKGGKRVSHMHYWGEVCSWRREQQV